MMIELKVFPGARKNTVQEELSGLKVYLTAPPVDGKANQALIEILAKHFQVKKRQIVIIKGLHSRQKTIRIEKV